MLINYWLIFAKNIFVLSNSESIPNFKFTSFKIWFNVFSQSRKISINRFFTNRTMISITPILYKHDEIDLAQPQLSLWFRKIEPQYMLITCLFKSMIIKLVPSLCFYMMSINANKITLLKIIMETNYWNNCYIIYFSVNVWSFHMFSAFLLFLDLFLGKDML